MKKIMISLFFCLVSYTHLQAKLDFTALKGTSAALVDTDKNIFAPVHGYIVYYGGVVKNICTYGNYGQLISVEQYTDEAAFPKMEKSAATALYNRAQKWLHPKLAQAKNDDEKTKEFKSWQYPYDAISALLQWLFVDTFIKERMLDGSLPIANESLFDPSLRVENLGKLLQCVTSSHLKHEAAFKNSIKEIVAGSAEEKITFADILYQALVDDGTFRGAEEAKGGDTISGASKIYPAGIVCKALAAYLWCVVENKEQLLQIYESAELIQQIIKNGQETVRHKSIRRVFKNGSYTKEDYNDLKTKLKTQALTLDEMAFLGYGYTQYEPTSLDWRNSIQSGPNEFFGKISIDDYTADRINPFVGLYNGLNFLKKSRIGIDNLLFVWNGLRGQNFSFDILRIQLRLVYYFVASNSLETQNEQFFQRYLSNCLKDQVLSSVYPIPKPGKSIWYNPLVISFMQYAQPALIFYDISSYFRTYDIGRAKINMLSQDDRGSKYTVLIQYVKSNSYSVSEVQDVLSFNPDVNVAELAYDGDNGKTALFYAGSDPKKLALLLAVPGLNVNVTYNHNVTVLEYYIQQRYPVESILLLINAKGANFDLLSALEFVINSYHPYEYKVEIIKVLLADLKLNVAESANSSLLMCLLRTHRFTVEEKKKLLPLFLQRSDNDFSVKDILGRTVLQYAEELGDQEIIAKIQNAMGVSEAKVDENQQATKIQKAERGRQARQKANKVKAQKKAAEAKQQAEQKAEADRLAAAAKKERVVQEEAARKAREGLELQEAQRQAAAKRSADAEEARQEKIAQEKAAAAKAEQEAQQRRKKEADRLAAEKQAKKKRQDGVKAALQVQTQELKELQYAAKRKEIEQYVQSKLSILPVVAGKKKITIELLQDLEMKETVLMGLVKGHQICLQELLKTINANIAIYEIENLDEFESFVNGRSALDMGKSVGDIFDEILSSRDDFDDWNSDDSDFDDSDDLNEDW